MSIIGKKFFIFDENGNIKLQFMTSIVNNVTIASIQERQRYVNKYFNDFSKKKL